MTINLAAPVTPVAERLPGAPPFKMTEMTNRLLNAVNSSSTNEVVGEDERTPVRAAVKPLVASMAAPSTPTKNILDVSEILLQQQQEGGVEMSMRTTELMATAIKKNLGTPGSNALARELLRRQDEVNILRREAEPVMTQIKRIASAGGPGEHIRVLVGRLVAMLEQYDKVVARYERQLQKLIVHMDRRRNEHEATQREVDASLTHRYNLQQRELEEAKERLAAAETQARLLRTEYEQTQRSLKARMELEEGRETENAGLRTEMERLRAELDRMRSNAISSLTTTSSSTASGTSELTMQRIEMLTEALEAAKQENAELRRQRELFPPTKNGTGNDEAEALRKRLAETLKAKDTQEAYFESLLATLRADMASAAENHQAALTAARADTEALRKQLADQEARAQQYSQAIDQSADRFFDERQQIQTRLMETEGELRVREEKMGQLVEALDALRAEKETVEGELQGSEQRLVELSRALASKQHPVNTTNGSEELMEARKQIAALEQAVLDLTERHQQKSPGAARPPAELATLRRQLEQVEFEKRQIEATLRQERARRESNNQRPEAARPTMTVQGGDAGRLKAELEGLKPALPRLIDRLSALFRTAASVQEPKPLNLDTIDRVYSDIKVSFEGLEGSRRRALEILRPGVGESEMVMDASGPLDHTPTAPKHRPIDHADIQPQRLF